VNLKSPRAKTLSFSRIDYADASFRTALFHLGSQLNSQVFEEKTHWDWLPDLEDAFYSACEAVYGGVSDENVSYEHETQWPTRAVMPVQGTNVTIMAPLFTLEQRVRFMAASMSQLADNFRDQKKGRAEAHVRHYSDYLHRFADRISRRPRG
jgi:hypothetical protein